MCITSYCTNCDSKTPYTIRYKIVKQVVRGVKFIYTEKTAYCSVCGKEIYVPEINDENSMARKTAYDEANGNIVHQSET